MSRESSAGIGTGCGLEDRMMGFRFPTEAGTFLFDIISIPALEPTQSPIQWVMEAFPWGVK